MDSLEFVQVWRFRVGIRGEYCKLGFGVRICESVSVCVEVCDCVTVRV